MVRGLRRREIRITTTSQTLISPGNDRREIAEPSYAYTPSAIRGAQKG